MSMDTFVVGFKPANEKWLKMKTIYNACLQAGIKPPKEVIDFFEGNPPDEKGVRVDIPKHEWSNESQAGFDVHLAEIPKDVTIIRFYNAW